MSTKGTTYDRLADLEGRVAALTRLCQQLLAGQGRINAPVQLRLAKRSLPPEPEEEEEPVEEDGSENTFYIKLLDGRYTKEHGTQEPTLSDRTTEPRFLCHSLSNAHISRDDPFFVIEHGGQFWCHEPGTVWGFLNQDLEYGDKATMSVCAFLVEGEGEEETVTPYDTELDIEIRDVLMNAADAPIAQFTRVVATRSGKHAILLAAHCEPESEENLPQPLETEEEEE